MTSGWPSHNCIDSNSKPNWQKWGHRFKEDKNFKKSPFQENVTLDEIWGPF